jgi:hypothetical protein
VRMPRREGDKAGQWRLSFALDITLAQVEARAPILGHAPVS